MDMRYVPLYTHGEVCRYARVLPSTLRYWTQQGGSPILQPAGRGAAAPFSFINLIEAYVLEALRRSHSVPMARIRGAVGWLTDKYQSAHPLAEIDLETDGLNLFVVDEGMTVAASQSGQIAIRQVLDPYLRRIERDGSSIPLRFYPFPHPNSPRVIVMDPLVAYGRPVIAGTRITTVTLFDRYIGGEPMSAIADDYALAPSDVEEAIRCEIERRAA